MPQSTQGIRLRHSQLNPGISQKTHVAKGRRMGQLADCDSVLLNFRRSCTVVASECLRPVAGLRCVYTTCPITTSACCGTMPRRPPHVTIIRSRHYQPTEIRKYKSRRFDQSLTCPTIDVRLR